MRFIEVIII